MSQNEAKTSVHHEYESKQQLIKLPQTNINPHNQSKPKANESEVKKEQRTNHTRPRNQ
jgi:hypothetical protein